jgi:hypothetical protein
MGDFNRLLAAQVFSAKVFEPLHLFNKPEIFKKMSVNLGIV